MPSDRPHTVAEGRIVGDAGSVSWREVRNEERLLAWSTAVYKNVASYASPIAKKLWGPLNENSNALYGSPLLRKLAEDARDERDFRLDQLRSELEGISPSAALWLMEGEIPSNVGDAYLLPRGGEAIGFGRCAWLMGTFGTGTANSKQDAHRFFRQFAYWAAAYLLHDGLERLERRALGKPTVLGQQAPTWRFMTPPTEMFWTTREISESAGRWVDTNLPRHSATLGAEVTKIMSTNVTAAIQETRIARLHRPYSPFQVQVMTAPFSTLLLEGIPEETLAPWTQSALAPTPVAIQEALTGHAPTLRPLVYIDGKRRALNLPGWLYGRANLMLREVMQKAPMHEEGDALEWITADLLGKWGPSGTTWTASTHISNPQAPKKSRDEVDVLGCSASTTFFVECKANRPPTNDASQDANFEQTILDKASKQLDTRIAHWREGWRASSDCSGPSETVGFIVTLDDYSGGVWQSRRPERDDVTSRYSVLPLPAMLLVAASCDTAKTFRKYMEMRTQLLSSAVMNVDELEFFMAFWQGLHKGVPREYEGYNLIFRQYRIGDDLGIDPASYYGERGWEDRFTREVLDAAQPAME